MERRREVTRKAVPLTVENGVIPFLSLRSRYLLMCRSTVSVFTSVDEPHIWFQRS